MKENRDLIRLLLILFITLVLISFVGEYGVVDLLFNYIAKYTLFFVGRRNYYINMCIGLMTGTLVSLVVSFVSYNYHRGELIRELETVAHLVVFSISCMNYKRNYDDNMCYISNIKGDVQKIRMGRISYTPLFWSTKTDKQHFARYDTLWIILEKTILLEGYIKNYDLLKAKGKENSKYSLTPLHKFFEELKHDQSIVDLCNSYQYEVQWEWDK